MMTCNPFSGEAIIQCRVPSIRLISYVLIVFMRSTPDARRAASMDRPACFASVCERWTESPGSRRRTITIFHDNQIESLSLNTEPATPVIKPLCQKPPSPITPMGRVWFILLTAAAEASDMPYPEAVLPELNGQTWPERDNQDRADINLPDLTFLKSRCSSLSDDKMNLFRAPAQKAGRTRRARLRQSLVQFARRLRRFLVDPGLSGCAGRPTACTKLVNPCSSTL